MKKFDLSLPVDAGADSLELLGEALEVEGGGTELARLFAVAKGALLDQLLSYWEHSRRGAERIPTPRPVLLMVKTLCWGFHLLRLSFETPKGSRAEYDSFESRIYLLDRDEIEGENGVELHEPELIGYYHDNGIQREVSLTANCFELPSQGSKEFRGEVRLVEVFPRGVGSSTSHFSVRIQLLNGELRPPIRSGQVILKHRITFRDVRSYVTAQMVIEIEKQRLKVQRNADQLRGFVAANPNAGLSELALQMRSVD